jgi:hypothetical protein
VFQVCLQNLRLQIIENAPSKTAAPRDLRITGFVDVTQDRNAT